MMWEHTRRRFGLAAEVQSRLLGVPGGAMARSGYAAGGLWVRPVDRFTARLDHQATLQGPENDQTRLGLQYQVWTPLALEARGVTGTAGRSLLGGAVLSMGASKMYVNERLDQGTSSRTTATVVGVQAPLGASSRAYTEYQWERGAEDRRMSLLGLQRRWDPTDGFTAFASGEHGEIESGAGRSTRSTVAGGLTWTRASGLTASSRGEVRFENGAADQTQWVNINHVEARVLGGLTLLGNLRWSATQDRRHDREIARFSEHSFGVAFRPESNDRLNGLARYTHLLDVRGEPSGDTLTAARAMDVVAAEAAFDVTRSVEWSGKGAVRKIKEGPDASRMRNTRSYLVIQRVDYALFAPVGLGLEYRMLTQREASDTRAGWLNEMTWKPAKHLRVGAGYNFTDFSDNEFSTNDYSVRGWFLRVQGKY
jgi:hypothetical protein